jgi:hypothetical protein
MLRRAGVTTGEAVSQAIAATERLVKELRKGCCPDGYIEKWLSEIARKAMEKAA